MVRKQWGSLLAGAAVVVAFGASISSAQGVTGAVTGTVINAENATVSGASVALISESRGTRMVPAITNLNGDFTIPNLTPDTYTLEVQHEGFKQLRRTAIAIRAGDRIRVPDLVMQAGAATEVVNLDGTAPPLIVEPRGERSSVLTAATIQALPLADRSFTALANLTSGVDGTDRLGGGTTNTLIDGLSAIDAGDSRAVLQLNTEAVAQVQVLASNYRAEFGRASGLQIVAVTRSGSNRFRGSVYDVFRDSDWDADSWADTRNGDTSPASRQSNWGYTLGGPVRAPGVANKLFFFVSQEWRPRSTSAGTSRFRVPTDLERAGDFSRTTDQNGNLYNLIRDTSTNLPCRATDTSGCFRDGGVLGRIGQDRLYDLGLNILKQYPRPNIDSVARPGLAYNYEVARPAENYLSNQHLVRADYLPFSTLRGTLTYAGEAQRQQTFSGSLPGFNDTRMPDPKVTSVSGTVHYALSSSAFLEGSVGFSRNAIAGCADLSQICTSSIPMNPNANKNTTGLGELPVYFPDALKGDARYDVYRQLGNVGAPFYQDDTILLPPSFQWGDRIGYAPPNVTLPASMSASRNFDAQVSLTKVARGHTFRLGGFLQRGRKRQTVGTAGPGTIDFGSSASNPLDASFGFANAALGVFSAYTQSSRLMEGDFAYRNMEAFLQDHWKVTRRLTLDLGVRWVRMQPHHDALKQGLNFIPEFYNLANAPVLYVAGCANGVYPCSGDNRQAQNPVTRAFLGSHSAAAIGTIALLSGDTFNGLRPADLSVEGTGYTYPRAELAPRVGVAYDLTGDQRVIVRGGAGLFFDRAGASTVAGMIGNPPNVRTVTVRSGDLRTLTTSGLAIENPPTLFAYEFFSNYPSSIQWNGGAQLALPWSSSLDVAYIGQHGYNLLQTVDINAVDLGAAFLAENTDPTLPAAAPGANPVPADQMRVFKGYGPIWTQWSRGWNWYHAVESTFTRAFDRGISFQLNHTLGLSNREPANARLEHTADGGFQYRGDQDRADELLSQGPLRRHTVRAHFTWDLPDLQASSDVPNVIRMLASDWQLSGVFRGGSGDRYSVGYRYLANGENVNLTGSPSVAPRVVMTTADPGAGCSDDPYKQFNTSIFRGPVVGSVGLESGRNYLVGCPSAFFDFAIARNIRLGGDRNLQLRLDIFNAFNHVAYTSRNTVLELSSPADPVTIANPQYTASGALVQTRLRPADAGFGAATGAAPLRSVQAWIKFSF